MKHAGKGVGPQHKRGVIGMGKEVTEILMNSASGIARAAELLSRGQLVAFPTETVYGLGADACNGEAVAAIYAAKGRPQFNPLIVHVPDIEAARGIGDFPREAEGFVKDGWPAGLTLVVPLRPKMEISPLVTAGLGTVALRVPVAATARALLMSFGGPVAAPSANISGRVSPTTAEHVSAGLDGKIAAILDGGSTKAGLESTIIGFADGVPVVLREGAFVVPDDTRRAAELRADTKKVSAPGQLLSHYAPKGAVRLGAVTKVEGEFHVGFGEVAGDVSLSPKGSLTEAAARLFAIFHEADSRNATAIAVAPIPDTGLGRAINDRLKRAAAPRR